MTDRTVSSWLKELDELTRLYRERVEGLGPDELNWKPDPETWSVGQILDHVITTNESYYPVVDRLRSGEAEVPWYGRFEPIPRLLGRFVLKAVEPERRRKVKTFPVWEPTSSDVPADIVPRFIAHQDELGRFLRGAEDLLSRAPVIPSPASRFLVYPLDTAIEILVTHERRHLNQLAETVERMREARRREN